MKLSFLAQAKAKIFNLTQLGDDIVDEYMHVALQHPFVSLGTQLRSLCAAIGFRPFTGVMLTAAKDVGREVFTATHEVDNQQTSAKTVTPG